MNTVMNIEKDGAGGTSKSADMVPVHRHQQAWTIPCLERMNVSVGEVCPQQLAW